MPLPDLLRLAEGALGGTSSPNLPEEVLGVVVEETASRAGVLRLDDKVIARWPRGVSQKLEEVAEGWTALPLGGETRVWSIRLLQPERLDEMVLGTTRLTLRAWHLGKELKRTRFDERFHLWELEAIRAIATSIGGILDRSRLADEMVSHLVALLGVRSVQLYLGVDVEHAELVAGFGAPALDKTQLAEAWQKGLCAEEVVAVPLMASTGNIGLLVAAQKEARAGTEPLASNDIRLLELFAIQVTVAMEYARLSRESVERERLKRELEMAATIQSHLLPQGFPDFAGFRIAARSTPSRQVAGDTYDVVVEDGCLIATVTDVSGKGVGAGMIASGVHSGVRLLSGEGLSLSVLAQRLNQYLVGSTADNRFATFALIEFEQDGCFKAVNAGHCPILIRRADGAVQEIESSGLPLGILADADYEEARDELRPGDLLVLYTDGLTEAEDPDEEEFGVERVIEVVSSLHEPTAEAACHVLLDKVAAFTCGVPLHDDATLLVIERLAED
ncbi:MAG: serine/threonine-protein phosphatase [bacterium]|nr:serine/threonine-protein phosphatase [bacterium]